MTLDDLRLGLKHSAAVRVTDALSVPAAAALFDSVAQMPPAFATAQMIAFIEWTCVAALQPYLVPQQRTVGTRIEMSHLAATPIGMMSRPKLSWSKSTAAGCASRWRAAMKAI
jgi:fluoroacetyl-CoA thioesterase